MYIEGTTTEDISLTACNPSLLYFGNSGISKLPGVTLLTRPIPKSRTPAPAAAGQSAGVFQLGSWLSQCCKPPLISSTVFLNFSITSAVVAFL